jgi:tetraacyldisaccharide 4'-kinase
LPVPGERVLAFSAIARPHDFTATLRAQGIGIVDSVAFPDHHRYTPVDITRIMSAFTSSGAEAFVTTEKDAVKLSPALRAPLEAAAPLLVARLHVEFLDPAAILSLLEARLS